MPTFQTLPEFQRNFRALSEDEQRKFAEVVKERFVPDLKAGKFRKGLRVKRIRTQPGVLEMTWAPNGRAAFSYGEPIREEEPHIIWHAIGGHEIF